MPGIDYSMLVQQQEQQTTSYPSYQYAADAHNTMQGQASVTDPSTWGDAVAGAGKFAIVATASGLNSFYNSAASVANWLGADIEQNDIAVQLAEFDDDLGKYYKQNREMADLVGFIGTSLVPGLAGIKLLNMGQKVLRTAAETGYLGANMSRATGLLAPAVDSFRIKAAADIATSAATHGSLGANTLKAIGAGYGQAALESAAFEIAVNATMFKAPTLSDQTPANIASHIFVGGLIGGAIGGAINHAVTFGGIKQATKGSSAIESAYRDSTITTNASPAQRIVLRKQGLENTPEVPTSIEIIDGKFTQFQTILSKLSPTEQIESAKALELKLTRIKTETTATVQAKNRLDVHELSAAKDVELSNIVADNLHGLNSDQLANNLTHLTEIGRVTTVLKAEAELAKHAQAVAKTLKGDLSADVPVAPFKLGYVQLRGAGQGSFSFEAPSVLSIADTLPTSKDVGLFVDKFKFSAEKAWSPTTATDHLETEARYIWAQKQEQLLPGAAIHEHDIPMLERAVADKLTDVKILSKDGNFNLSSNQDILRYLQDTKLSVAEELLVKNKLPSPVIAKMVNVDSELLEGQVAASEIQSYFANQTNVARYIKMQEKNGLPVKSTTEFLMSPSVAKVAYDIKGISTLNDMELSGIAYIKAQQQLQASVVNNVVARHMPEDLFNSFVHPSDAVLQAADRYGAGPGIVTSANGGYGSLASFMEANGATTSRLQQHFKNNTSDALSSHVTRLASDREAAIAFEAVNQKLMSSAELYGISPDGNALEPLKIIAWREKVANGSKVAKPELAEGTIEKIVVENPVAMAAWEARTQLTGNRTTAYSNIRNAQGLEDFKDPRAVRPIRQDPKDYPFFALVTDPTITGVGHKSMIHAASAKELDALISKVPAQFEVRKGNELKEYFKSHGEFDFERSLHENYIDSNLKSKGVNSPFFVRSDPNLIAKSLLEDHLRSDNIFARELVNAKFEREFQYLRQQGEQFTSSAASKYTGSFRSIEQTANNPYTNYVKTALNISQTSEHPLLSGVNTQLDMYVSKAWNSLGDAFRKTQSPADLANVNALLNKYGVKSAYADAANMLLANHTAPRGVLTNFVSSANSMLSTVVLRLDFLNSINNVVGAGVLYGSEVASVTRAIKSGDSEAVGALSKLLESPAPSEAALAGQASDMIRSPTKLLLNAVKNFTDSEAKTIDGILLKDYYKANGWSTRIKDQYHAALDDLTLIGNESATVLQSKLASAFSKMKVLGDKGEVLTGNKLAEEFNRFVAADSMRQLTDIAISKGLITEAERVAYINTFVNRTQGNILASQRPLLFQGPIGQAIGLFQSYQFNTMQQLFRHVAEGAPKDAATLLGLQGTIFGMNGLPAFDFLNTHIIGSASGNPQHKDLYTATYGVVGKTVGDLLLYGIPSNLLQTNLYTRGDVNPRQLTIVPTNPADIPFVSATVKMYDGVKTMLSRAENGGAIWQTLLQGIEHNGLSRPLAGIAQTAQALSNNGQVFSTTRQGNLAGTNDLFSWATASRIAGGKPLDESIVTDAAFRMTAYKAADRAKMEALSQAVKTTYAGKGQPDADEVTEFATRYAQRGGNQKNFNQYMLTQMKNANTTKAQRIIDNLQSPMSARMQEIMGGYPEINGFTAYGQ